MSAALQRLFNRKRSNTTSAKHQQQRQETQAIEEEARAKKNLISSRRHTLQAGAALSLNAGSAYNSDFAPASVSQHSTGRPALTTSSLNSNSSIASSRAWSRSRSHTIATAFDAQSIFESEAAALNNDQDNIDGDDDDDDIESNGLYSALSKHLSTLPDWGGTAIILVPRSDPHIKGEVLSEVKRSSAYLALHAFAPSRLFKDQYVSITRWNESVQGRQRDWATGEQDSRNFSGPSSLIDDALAHDVRQGEPKESRTDIWDRVSVTATLSHGGDAIVHLTLKMGLVAAGAIERTVHRDVRITGELTLYPDVPVRQMSTPSVTTGFQVLSRPTTKQRDKIRVRVLSVDGLVVPIDSLNPKMAHGRNTGASTRLETFPARESNSTAPSPSGSIAFPTFALPPEDPDSTCTPADFYTPRAAAFPTNARIRSRSSSAASSVSLRHGEEIRDPVSAAIGAQRNFFADLLLLISPPSALAATQPTLEATFATLRQAAIIDFSSFVYVPGFEAASAARMRTVILDRTLDVLNQQLMANSMMQLSQEATLRLVSAVENVASGACLPKFYGVLLQHLSEQDSELDSILQRYRSAGLTLRDFDLKEGAMREGQGKLNDAVAAFSKLGPPIPSFADEPVDVVTLVAHPSAAELRMMMTPSPSHHDQQSTKAEVTASVRSFFSIPSLATPYVTLRTPAYVLGVLMATIDSISLAVSKASIGGSRSSLNLLSSAAESSTPISMDEILPILAYVIMKAGQKCLFSLMRYLQHFTLSPVSPESRWALVTFDAAIEYLRTDPCAALTAGPSSMHPSRRSGLASPSQKKERPLSISSLVASPADISTGGGRSRRPSLVLQHGSWGSAHPRRTSLSAASLALSSPTYTLHGTSSPDVDLNNSGYFGTINSFSDDGHIHQVSSQRGDSPDSSRTSLDVFKLPGQPASAMRRMPRSMSTIAGMGSGAQLVRSNSVLRAVGEGTVARDDHRSGSVSPDYSGELKAVDLEHRVRTHSLSHRTGIRVSTSSAISDSSGSAISKGNDLHIRERIVVRSPYRRPITYSSLSFSERRKALESVAQGDQPAAPALASSAMERTSSENIPSPRSAFPILPGVRRDDSRRQSLDSLTALTMLNNLQLSGSQSNKVSPKRTLGWNSLSSSTSAANWLSFLSHASEVRGESSNTHERSHSVPDSHANHVHWLSKESPIAASQPAEGSLTAHVGLHRSRSGRSASSLSSGHEDALPRTPSNTTLATYLTLPQRTREHTSSSASTGSMLTSPGSASSRSLSDLIAQPTASTSTPIMHAESVTADLSPPQASITSTTVSARAVLESVSSANKVNPGELGSPKSSQKNSHTLPGHPVYFRLHVPSPVHELADPMLSSKLPSST